MLTHEKLARQGHWLFKNRSTVPVAILLAGFLALHDMTFFHHRDLSLTWGLICILIGIPGFVLRCWVIATVPDGTSGRNTDGQLAETLNTTGWYSVVRNPLYLGNFLMWLGIALAFGSPLFFVTFILSFTVFYERIVATEEAFLMEKFGSTYEAWHRRTPCFIPDFSLWKKPVEAFNLRKALSQEYRGFCAFILSICLVKAGGDFVEVGHFTPISFIWEHIAWASLAVLVAFRLPKRIGLRRVFKGHDSPNVVFLKTGPSAEDDVDAADVHLRDKTRR